MSAAAVLSSETELLARELFALLEAIDPSRFRDELAPALGEKVRGLRRQLQALLLRAELSGDPRLEALRELLGELALLLEALPPVEGPVDRLRAEWDAFRHRLQPAYEELAAALRGLNTVPLPSLRPTNYTRNLFHIGSGVMCILLVQHVLSPAMTTAVAGAFTALGWTFEVSRRRSEAINRLLMWALGPVAHPHERHRINSATWFTTALFLLAISASPRSITVALSVLAFGDPFAAIVGRRWGRTRLVARRSLEGSAAFVLLGGAAAAAFLRLYYPGMPPAELLAMAGAGALAGAVAELFCGAVDDNLGIPLAAAAGAGFVGLIL